MSANLKKIAAKGIIVSVVFSLNIIVFIAALYYNHAMVWALSITISLTVLAIYNSRRQNNTIFRK